MRAFTYKKISLACLSALLVSGCAAPGMDLSLKEANELASSVTGGAQARLARDKKQGQESAGMVDELLSKPLTMEGAVALALAHSPQFQATMARSWGDLASAAQRGQPGGLLFSLERLGSGPSLEINRMMSFGLFDLITLPQRRAVAKTESEQTRLRLAGSIVDQATMARQAWTRAVGAKQMEAYAEQVNEAAQASALLARRMLEVGNFSKLQAARQQLFYAEATELLATRRQAAVETREALARHVGLSDEQAARLALPERLPDLPKQPKTEQEISAQLGSQRLDARIARLDIDALGKSRGMDLAKSFVDVEASVSRNSRPDGMGGREAQKGVGLSIRLPIFDWGSIRRDELDARALAALNQYEAIARSASSQAREGYGAYRTAFDQARHQRDELVPLRKLISEENMLRYNGMQIGVFEMLADAREQIAGVSAAVEAQQNFWLADAELSSTLIGRPRSGPTAIER
jgi:outer membrane protein TolC